MTSFLYLRNGQKLATKEIMIQNQTERREVLVRNKN